jgi:hypothetical protein
MTSKGIEASGTHVISLGLLCVRERSSATILGGRLVSFFFRVMMNFAFPGATVKHNSTAFYLPQSGD